MVDVCEEALKKIFFLICELFRDVRQAYLNYHKMTISNNTMPSRTKYVKGNSFSWIGVVFLISVTISIDSQHYWLADFC